MDNKDMATTPSPVEHCWTTYYKGLAHPSGAKCQLDFNHLGGHEGRDSSGLNQKWKVVRKEFAAAITARGRKDTR